MILMMVGIVYFLIIRPQRRRDRERTDLLGRIKVKDDIVTIGGIHGKILSMKEDEVTLLIDARKDIQMKVARASVSPSLG